MNDWYKSYINGIPRNTMKRIQETYGIGPCHGCTACKGSCDLGHNLLDDKGHFWLEVTDGEWVCDKCETVAYISPFVEGA